MNTNSIMQKVRAYINSSAGKNRSEKYIYECRVKDKKITEAGSRVITFRDMCIAADSLIEMIYDAASKRAVPSSVLNHIGSLKYLGPYEVGNKSTDKVYYKIEFYFEDDLSRPSLYKEKYDGIDNIVALINNGYSARDYVYGIWSGHENLGRIRSRIERDGSHFIQIAINDFNRLLGAFYKAEATEGAEYITL